MPAPTLIATIQIDSPWAQVANIGAGVATKVYPSAFTALAGDLIVALQGSSDAAVSNTLGDTGSVNGTYTNQANIQNSGHCSLGISSVTSAAGSETVTLTRSTSINPGDVGGAAFQFRNHGGIGNVFAATDDVQTGNLTCSANSAILVLCLSWAATAGSPTWATINGSAPTSTGGVPGDSSTWAAHWAYWANIGSAGSKTITLSSPAMGAQTFAAIEIKAGADVGFAKLAPHTGPGRFLLGNAGSGRRMLNFFLPSTYPAAAIVDGFDPALMAAMQWQQPLVFSPPQVVAAGMTPPDSKPT